MGENMGLTELREQIRSLPSRPGIYKYFDQEGKILYIGKARNLKKRVSSYFTAKTGISRRINLMVSKITRIEFTVVNTEYDALLLENSLIKKYQPRYNINLKDGKTYPFIVIKNERFPRVFSTRTMVRDGSEYFGPYASVGVMNVILDLIRKLFTLRTCNFDLSQKNIENGKFRVCLDYQINLCKGPCEGFQSEEDYNENIRNIREILKGNTQEVLKRLKNLMVDSVSALEFEKAEDYRQKIEALEKFQAKSTVVNPRIHNVDVFSIFSKENRSFVNYLKVVNGAIIQTDTIEYRKKLDEDDRDVLLLAIAELREKFMSNSSEVIVPLDLDFEFQEFETIVPKIGDKKKLLDLSRKNAYYYYQDRQKQAKARLPKTEKTNILLDRVKLDLGLKSIPHRIECFDNSNIQGSNPVSAMVCFLNGVPAKSEYRHFNVRTVEGPDDFATMEEVVYRRYSRVLQEESPLPELIVIDGGKGQLNAALKSLVRLGIEDQTAIIGIAKRLEEIYRPGDPYPLYIDKTSPTLKLIQHLRNEAHRFGITHHRNRRIKSSLVNELEEIPGIGSKTAKALLSEFRSIKKLREADPEAIISLVGKDKADKVLEYFGRG